MGFERRGQYWLQEDERDLSVDVCSLVRQYWKPGMNVRYATHQSIPKYTRIAGRNLGPLSHILRATLPKLHHRGVHNVFDLPISNMRRP